MTIINKLVTLLTDHGLWPNEIAEVLSIIKSAPENESMTGRWDDEESDYPPAIMTLAWMSAKAHAIDYLEKTKPKHFALALLKYIQE